MWIWEAHRPSCRPVAQLTLSILPIAFIRNYNLEASNPSLLPLTGEHISRYGFMLMALSWLHSSVVFWKLHQRPKKISHVRHAFGFATFTVSRSRWSYSRTLSCSYLFVLKYEKRESLDWATRRHGLLTRSKRHLSWFETNNNRLLLLCRISERKCVDMIIIYKTYINLSLT